MKIALPVDKNHEDTPVCMSFGRTPFFMIYNTETQGVEFLDNAAAAAQGGAGIKASQMLIDNQVGALIAPRLGENAADVLNAGAILVYQQIEGNAMANLEAYKRGDLSPLTSIHKGFHNHGGQ